MSAALADLSLAELRRALRARETTARAVTEAVLARVQERDGHVHAFASVTADAALGAARDADEALARGSGGPLAGLPVAVKDLMAVRGVARTNGSRVFQGEAPATSEATVVARLRAAGAVIVGTTHLHELAFGPTGVNPELGTPRNAWGADRVPGGSSSGSGAAVAARLVPGALGTDTGGSIRIPASFCGISGLKPTYGRVSRAGVTPLSWTLDHVGPMARSVEDLGLLLGVLAGHDPADATSARLPVPDYGALLDRGLRGVRIGVPRDYSLKVADPEVAAGFDRALAELRSAGVAVTDVSLPTLTPLAAAALGAIILTEANAALEPLIGKRRDRLGLEARVYFEFAKVVTGGHYVAAQRLRTRLYTEMLGVLERVDLLATPGTVLPAPRIGELQVRLDGVEVGTTDAITRLTGPFNLTGLPALVIPCGFTGGGLPIGLQLVGRPFAEADVLAVGHAYQRSTDWHRRVPPG